ncbi:hypothetical protein RF11_06502 [Thelohanellus kitauei]|uniref:Uncharacterized protein n=1 Tax=Thelohanellus kitauei TaxID=669202 RepID=A0A0C2JBF1_THEKT|nr:hypothetical protein RF11_06502 [Thelohanellus kitauei]
MRAERSRPFLSRPLSPHSSTLSTLELWEHCHGPKQDLAVLLTRKPVANRESAHIQASGMETIGRCSVEMFGASCAREHVRHGQRCGDQALATMSAQSVVLTQQSGGAVAHPRPPFNILGPRRCRLGCKCSGRSKKAHKCPEEKRAMKNGRLATFQGDLEGAHNRSLFLTRTL